MFNIRKTKYVVITDGIAEKEKANVIACDDIYAAQDVFKKALEDDLDPIMLETERFIDNSIQDRYVGYKPTAEKATKEALRKIISKTI